VLKTWTPGAALCALLVVALSVIPLAWQSTRVASSQAAATELQGATAPPTAQRARTAEPLTQAAPSPVSTQAGVPDAQAERPSQPLAASTPTPLPVLDAALTDELQALLDDVVDGFVPGVVLSVSVPGYAPWSGASGLADRAQGRAMTPDTPVRIASVSKMFTGLNQAQTESERSRGGGPRSCACRYGPVKCGAVASPIHTKLSRFCVNFGALFMEPGVYAIADTQRPNRGDPGRHGDHSPTEQILSYDASLV
jgi:hypothetical protein